MRFKNRCIDLRKRGTGDHFPARRRRTERGREKDDRDHFTLLLVTSILLSGICYLLREPILRLLNTPEESYSLTYDYAVTCILGLVFIYGYNVVSAILRGIQSV